MAFTQKADMNPAIFKDLAPNTPRPAPLQSGGCWVVWGLVFLCGRGALNRFIPRFRSCLA